MYRVIGAASGWGAKLHACEKGPEILKAAGLLEQFRVKGIPISHFMMLYPEKRAKDTTLTHKEALPIIRTFNSKLAEEVENTLVAGEFPIVLGGDHTVAVGTWNGAYRYFQEKGNLPMGLIWIDAHMDSHTPMTTPSGAWHGMPLAALMGYGEPMIGKRLKDPIVLPENVCLIGVRSYEAGEAKLLESLNVKVFFAEEVRDKGMEKVMKEATAHVTKNTKVFGVTIDLDVITPEEAPGVGSPEENGIRVSELLKGVEEFRDHPKFKVFELVEFNPERNHHAMTAKLCFEILLKVMKNDE